MGQYFYFYNDFDEINDYNLTGCPGINISWVSKLNTYDEDEVIEFFKIVIEKNNWQDQNKITARGDYGDEIIYDVKTESIVYEE